MKRKAKNGMKNSSTDLYEELNQAKQLKDKYSSSIKTSVKNNKIIIRKSQSQTNISKIQPLPKLSLKKQKSMQMLSKSLNQRLRMDQQAKLKLEEMNGEYSDKRMQLQKRIEEVKKRNQQRLKQLSQFQAIQLKRINAQYMKDKEKQQHLLAEYERALKQQGKVRETKAYRQALQAQDWQNILKQKKKLQTMIKQYAKKQETLIRQQNPQLLQRVRQQAKIRLMLEQKQAEVVAPTEKRQKKKGDHKQIGNQYLQYAKKLKQIPKQKAKMRMLDVNLKCIDYEGDIMNKIARNTGDLSKFRAEIMMPVTVKSSKQTKGNTQKQKPAMMFQVKQDEETKRYLKEIRGNLSALQKQ